MKKKPIIEDGVIAGNLYPKYTSRNPINKFFVGRFLSGVDKLVSIINPLNIHEVGCGEGYLISRFAGKGIKLVGSDFSEQVIALARHNNTIKGYEINYKIKSVYSVDEAEDSANLVICAEVFEHLENPSEALAALSRISKPYILASVPREPIWRVLNIVRGKYLIDLGNTPGHLHHWSKPAFINFMEKRFDIIQILSPLPWTLVLARVKNQ